MKKEHQPKRLGRFTTITGGFALGFLAAISGCAEKDSEAIDDHSLDGASPSPAATRTLEPVGSPPVEIPEQTSQPSFEPIQTPIQEQQPPTPTQVLTPIPIETPFTTPKPVQTLPPTPQPTPEPISIPNSEIIDGLVVVGPEDFRQRTKTALDRLRPTEWFEFVTKRLKRVVLIDRDSRLNLTTGTFQVTRLVAFANDDAGAIQDSIDWYACTLVHESQHLEAYRNRAPHFGAEAEIDANKVQIKCLTAIGANQRHITHIQNFNACIAAGGCNFWDTPHEYKVPKNSIDTLIIRLLEWI